MPPAGSSARPVLCTSMAEIASAAMLAKSKERELEVPPPPGPRLEAGIWRPLNRTRLKSGPMPRTVTLEPSPLDVRSIDTPEMRCSASARLVSGNLPMSSATMPSTMPCASRLRFIDEVRLARMPVTTTVSSSVGSTAAFGSAVAAACGAWSWAMAWVAGASASSSADVSSRFLGKACLWFMGSPSRNRTNSIELWPDAVPGQSPTRRIRGRSDSVVKPAARGARKTLKKRRKRRNSMLRGNKEQRCHAQKASRYI